MNIRLNPAIRKFRAFIPILLAALLLACPFPETDLRAESLLQSARNFGCDYHFGSTKNLLGDVTSDGYRDIILVHVQFEGTGYPLVSTFPGLGDGTIGDPVETVVDVGFGAVYDAVLTSVDGDKHLDLILNAWLITEDVHAVLVLLGNGDGSFTLGNTLELGHDSHNVAAADFTGDGITDFAVNVSSTTDPWSVRLFQGAGDGTFTEHGSTGTLRQANTMVGGDIDDDGDTDLIAALEDESAITLLVNDGSGQFTTRYSYAPYKITHLVAGDLDDDGCDDVAASSRWDGTVGIYFGNPDGSLSPYVPMDAGGDVKGLDLGDLDDDGDLDLVANTRAVEYPYPGRVAVWLNGGAGDFTDPDCAFRGGYDISLGDMNGDGALDAVMNTLDSHDDYLCILLGTGGGGFQTMTDLVAEESLNDISCTDVDLDGDQDLVAANVEDGVQALQVLLNNGDGTFADPATYGNGNQPLFSDTGDLNGDGYPEIFFTSTDLHTLEILQNNGDGTFQFHQSIPLGNNPQELRPGDLDGDGDLDLAVVYRNILGVLINPGTGVFSGVASYVAVDYLECLVLGDADGDGDLDAMVTSEFYTDSGVYLMRNDGEGAFSAPEAVLSTDNSSALAMTDLDGDGDLDLAVGQYQTMRILLNDGAGTFTEAPAGGAGIEYVESLGTGDLNRDGRTDLVAGTRNDVVFIPGAGGGTFGPAERYPQDVGIEALDLADLDGDGSIDVAVCGHTDVNLSVFFNRMSITGLLATGPGRGEFNPALVRIFATPGSGDPMAQWSAYGVDRYGVNVALGELTGSGDPEVVTGAGPGAVFGPHVRGFDINGTPLPGVSFLAYGTNKYGVNATCGDLDNDGFDEIVTGAGPGAVFGPHVRGWNWDGAGAPTPISGISYFAYGTPKWGVNVACGDIDGDGFDEIVTGAGPGAVYGPHVRGWNCDGGGASSIPDVSFFAYGTLKWGVNVCCGDIDGDGIDEMVTGAGPGAVFGPHVRAWNWDGTGSAQSIPAVSFFAYDYTQWGVNVSCGDLDDDGIDEILTGPGPGESHLPRVRGWKYDGQSLAAMVGVDFLAFDQAVVTHGVKVAGAR